MVFGDGDGTVFNRFTIALDVIGHELTHGVTQYEAKLIYLNQPGALNESMLGRVRLAGQAVRAEADGRPGRLADRRGLAERSRGRLCAP